MVNISAMRHRLTLEENQPIKDDGGGQGASWVAIQTLWGAVKPAQFKSSYTVAERGGQVVPEKNYEVTVRYYEGITDKHRLIYRGRVLDIKSFLVVDERREFIKLFCTEGV